MIHLAVRLNGSGLIGDIVNIFTKSKSSHVGLVFTDGTSLEVTPEFIGLRDDVTYDFYNWALIPCPFLSYQDEQKIKAELDEILAQHPKYDYLGAISGVFGSYRQDDSKWYCSELVARLLEDYMSEFQSDRNKRKWITPETVWKVVADKVAEYNPEWLKQWKFRFNKNA